MELDPEAAAFLERTRAAGVAAPHQGTPQQARDAHLASASAMAGPGEPVEQVWDAEADGVPVRIYRPAGARGTTVYVHGGGWVVGTVDTYDTLCRALANRSASTVVSVDYSLAPEARHPRQLQQVGTVLGWTRSAAGPQPADPTAIGGDSAGGYLAAWATIEARRAGLDLEAQVLIYPVVDPGLDTPSARSHASGYYLETESMRWYWQHYLGAQPAPANLCAQDLTGLPPALVITAGFDPLRDEGARYADALRSAGVEVQYEEYPAQIHGFARFTAMFGAASDALAQAGAFLRERLRAAELLGPGDR